MKSNGFKLTQQQKFLRGLIFLSTGIFLLLQFAADGSGNVWLQGMSWIVAIFTAAALAAFLWTLFQRR